jgi:hypothetical protein
MKVFSSGSNKQNAAMAAAARSAANALRIAEQPATRARKAKLLDRLREAHAGGGREQEMADGEESWR